MDTRTKLHYHLREHTDWTFSQIAAYIAGYLDEDPSEDVADWPTFYREGQADKEAGCFTQE